MSSVWVIEQGDYSDYRVVGVFSSKENAERVCALIADEYARPTVAEWPLDPAISELNQGLTVWSVHMRRDGTTERCEKVARLDTSFHLWRRSRITGGPDVIAASVWASDEQHAIKIVNEKRAEWIALGKWDEQP